MTTETIIAFTTITGGNMINGGCNLENTTDTITAIVNAGIVTTGMRGLATVTNIVGTIQGATVATTGDIGIVE